MEPDDVDLKILSLLQENAHLTIKEIAAAIHLSSTPVHERIRKLEAQGIIEKYVALLNKRKLGPYLMVYCNVTLSKQVQEHFLAFNEAISAMSEVVECNVVSGNFDYLLKLIVRDMEAYQQLYLTRLSVLKGVDKISSFFVMSEVKNTTVLPLT
jgi:Lrp/AsnC family leucine-responsive transcriptional regulator